MLVVKQNLVKAVNRKYFDVEADRYLEYSHIYRGRMLDLFFENFVWRLDMTNPLPVLEVGQGAGVLGEAVLTSGLKYTTIDMSARMLTVAQRYLSIHVPGKLGNAEFIHTDVLDWAPFTKRNFQAILLQAVIHLFPKVTARELLQHMMSSLQKRGYVWLATTEAKESSEGWFIDANPKMPVGIKEGISSFRAFYTKEEFLSLARSVGLEVIRLIENQDAERDHVRTWMILVCQKNV